MLNYRVYLEWADNGIPWTADFTIAALSAEDAIRKVRELTSSYLNVLIRSVILEDK